MDDDVVLVVNGKKYGGWKSVRITRSIESMAGSFSLEASDRWDGQVDPWPIANEDACRVEISNPDGTSSVMIDGFVDVTEIDASESSRGLQYNGKDAASAFVECSAANQGASVTAKVGGGGDLDPTKHGKDAVKWTYTNIDFVAFVRAIAHQFGLGVSVQPGLTFPRASKLVVSPGETGFETVKRVAEQVGALLVSDGAGGILITRAGTARAEGLIEGFNIKRIRRRSDATARFRRYIISTQIPGTDEVSGEELQIQAEATDVDVRRKNRVILIRPDKGYNTADAKKRADWEARIRAARSETITVTLQGWRQRSGALWPLNALATVSAPKLAGILGDMLISQVEFSIGSDGRETQLNLVRPDAFAPEPTATVSGEALWSELRTGGL